MATTEERLVWLEQEMAKLPTKTQIQQLSDLVQQYQADLLSLTNDMATRINTLEVQVADLRSRVTSLENP